MKTITVQLTGLLCIPEGDREPTIDELLKALIDTGNKAGKGYGGYAVCAPGKLTADLVFIDAKVTTELVHVRKHACTRTNPKKVEEVIRAGGGVQTPMEETCPACRQPWDISHLMVIYDVVEARDARR